MLQSIDFYNIIYLILITVNALEIVYFFIRHFLYNNRLAIRICAKFNDLVIFVRESLKGELLQKIQ